MVKEIEIIKNVVREEVEKRGVKVLKFILFGSRARGDCKKGSDWDLIVITDKDMRYEEEDDALYNIGERLAKLRIRNDIIIRSEEKFEKAKNWIGCASYYANRDGVVI